MDERTKWEVEQLQKESEIHKQDINDLKAFKTSTIEKLKTVFVRIKDLESSNKWMGQSFFYLLGGGVVTAVTSLIVWLVQK